MRDMNTDGQTAKAWDYPNTAAGTKAWLRALLDATPDNATPLQMAELIGSLNHAQNKLQLAIDAAAGPPERNERGAVEVLVDVR